MPTSGSVGGGALTTIYTYDTEYRLTALASGGNTIGVYAYDGAGNAEQQQHERTVAAMLDAA
jgi:hypothetical protein